MGALAGKAVGAADSMIGQRERCLVGINSNGDPPLTPEDLASERTPCFDHDEPPPGVQLLSSSSHHATLMII